MARSFVCEGAVGLGIVAALSGGGRAAASELRAPRQRSKPIPILSASGGDRRAIEIEEMEGEATMSESYTCVISRLDGGPETKRVYEGGNRGSAADLWACCPPLLFESPPPQDFLRRCSYCRKPLHGYGLPTPMECREEKAFCSRECRSRQMSSAEQARWKYYAGSPAAAAAGGMGFSVSPCATPLPAAA